MSTKNFRIYKKSRRSYVRLRDSILKILDDNPDLSYNRLYKCVKFEAICPHKDIFCEHYEDEDVCSQPRKFCEHHTKNGDCSQHSRKCDYLTNDGKCSELGESCSDYEIKETHSKATFAKCVEELCFTGDIKRTENEFIDGREPVLFSVNAAKILYVDEEFDCELEANQRLVLLVPPSLGPNESKDRIINRYGPTGKLQIKEYKLPLNPLPPLRIYLHLETRSPYAFNFSESIRANRYRSEKLLKEVDNKSPFGFEEQHFKVIVESIVRLLNELIVYLHTYSRTHNRKSALVQYRAVAETHFYPSFFQLTSLVRPSMDTPLLKMSEETFQLVGRCFDYAYSVALLEEKQNYLSYLHADNSVRVPDTLCELDVYSRPDYAERIGHIIKILHNSSQLQYNELYETLNAEDGKTISKATFEKCLKFLVSSGLITRRQISGHGRGKHVQISKNNTYTDFELYHWIVIWTQIRSIVRLLVSELYTYSNERNRLARYNRYDKFLRRQLIPNLTDLSTLVSLPLEMSVGTKFTLFGLSSKATYAFINGAVRHSLNDLTPAENTQISNGLKGMRLSSPPEGRYSPLFPKSIADSIEYIESRKLAAELLNDIRKNRVPIASRKHRVGKKCGRPKKPLSDDEKALIDHVYSEYKVGACALEKIIEEKYNKKISHNKIHKHLASMSKSPRKRE